MLPPKIAIIDDDDSVRIGLTRLLMSSQYRTSAFSSVEDFLATLHDDTPQCILVDYRMPRMTGLELQSHLQKAGVAVPIIIITAHNEPTIRENCIKAGVSAFLIKPVSKKTLLDSVVYAIAKPPPA
jgi:FixJ family two-component response regulator